MMDRFPSVEAIHPPDQEQRKYGFPFPTGRKSTAMSTATYQRSYRRVRPKRQTYAAGYLPNSAAHLTDHGADPKPCDLAWCIRRRWRVLYYGARYAARQPLWQGVNAFDEGMAQVLVLLSSGFEPISPLHAARPVRSDDGPADVRKVRVN
jgi:hypothetical protein